MVYCFSRGGRVGQCSGRGQPHIHYVSKCIGPLPSQKCVCRSRYVPVADRSAAWWTNPPPGWADTSAGGGAVGLLGGFAGLDPHTAVRNPVADVPSDTDISRGPGACVGADRAGTATECRQRPLGENHTPVFWWRSLAQSLRPFVHSEVRGSENPGRAARSMSPITWLTRRFRWKFAMVGSGGGVGSAAMRDGQRFRLCQLLASRVGSKGRGKEGSVSYETPESL